MSKKTKRSKSPKKEDEFLPLTENDLTMLYDLFSVLSNEKRLKILKATITDNVTRLKDLADLIEEKKKSSAQIALHAKKLHNAGLLKKEGASYRDTREYVPTIGKETYIFLRLALVYAKMLYSRRTELELLHLKANAEATTEKLTSSPILAGTLSFSEIPTQYLESIKLAHQSFIELAKQFSRAINVSEI